MTFTATLLATALFVPSMPPPEYADCGEWKVVNLVTGDKFTCDGASGRAALDWKLRLNALVFKPFSRCTHQRRAASVTRQNVYVCCCGGIMMML